MKDWSQEYLAEKIGVSRRTIVRMENGLAPIDFERIANVATAFGVSVQDIWDAVQKAA